MDFFKKYITYLLISVLSILLIFNLLKSEFFHITKIEIEGEAKTLEKDILNNMNKFKNNSIIFVDTKKLEEEILKDARVLNISIEKKYPSKIKIKVNERKIAAFINLDKLYVVDENMNIFSNFSETKNKNFPIISNELKDEKEIVSKILNKLIKSDIFLKSSEIIKYEDFFAIILQDGVRIFLTDEITTKKLNEANKVHEIEKENKAIEYIDLRFNNIIAKFY